MWFTRMEHTINHSLTLHTGWLNIEITTYGIKPYLILYLYHHIVARRILKPTKGIKARHRVVDVTHADFELALLQTDISCDQGPFS